MGGRSREIPNSTPASAREGRFNNVAENGNLKSFVKGGPPTYLREWYRRRLGRSCMEACRFRNRHAQARGGIDVELPLIPHSPLSPRERVGCGIL